MKEQDLENSNSESDSSTEDEEANDPKFEKKFFQVLSLIQSKDPKIYDKECKLFSDSSSDEEDNEENTTKSKKQKPMTINDYERKVIVEKDGKYDDDESEDEHSNKFKEQDLTYVEEQRKLKQEFRKALNQDDSDDEFGGIFKKRTKSKAEQEKEEGEYAEWLAGRIDDESLKDEEAKKSLAPLKKYWNNPTLSSSDKFLRDYILTNGYADTNPDDIPTYEEIIGDKEEDEKFSEDENELEKQAEFEHKYNFRYEEPDDEFIKRYPRTVESSLRMSETKRKQKRQEEKDKKIEEKETKRKQLLILQELKRKEIEEKMEKLRKVAGKDIMINEDELDEDFDPDAHDRMQQELYGDEYYVDTIDEQKPECDDIEELQFENWDYDLKEDNSECREDAGECDDEDFNMDCDFDPQAAAEARKKSLQQELIENTTRKRKRNKFGEMLKKKKPSFKDSGMTYDEYLNKYYELDNCVDGFNYQDVEANEYGLTFDEVWC